MARMIDQLLDFTRIRLGQGLPLSRSKNDLAEVCRMAIDELDGAAEGVDLRVRENTVGSWDGDRLMQLVSNLIGNALAHGAGTGPVQVIVDGHSAEEVVLEVKNAGRDRAGGIGRHLRAVPQRKGSEGGSVERARAGLVHHPADRPCPFRLDRGPFDTRGRNVLHGPSAARLAAEPEKVMQRKTVLVVDDEPDIRDSLRDALEDEGYQWPSPATAGRRSTRLRRCRGRSGSSSTSSCPS